MVARKLGQQHGRRDQHRCAALRRAVLQMGVTLVNTCQGDVEVAGRVVHRRRVKHLFGCIIACAATMVRKIPRTLATVGLPYGVQNSRSRTSGPIMVIAMRATATVAQVRDGGCGLRLHRATAATAAPSVRRPATVGSLLPTPAAAVRRRAPRRPHGRPCRARHACCHRPGTCGCSRKGLRTGHKGLQSQRSESLDIALTPFDITSQDIPRHVDVVQRHSLTVTTSMSETTYPDTVISCWPCSGSGSCGRPDTGVASNSGGKGPRAGVPGRGSRPSSCVAGCSDRAHACVPPCGRDRPLMPVGSGLACLLIGVLRTVASAHVKV